MKKLWIAAFLVLYGCGSQPTQEEGGAAVEERGPAATPARPPVAAPAPARPPAAVTPQPVKPVQVQMDPLKDPKNILSKRSVYYDYDRDLIKEEFRPMLQAHAKYLADRPGAKMLVQGNADERGSREYNLALGQRRADGVKRMLVLMGAREAQIEAVSLGEEKPRRTGKSEDDYAENRRSDMLHGGEF